MAWGPMHIKTIQGLLACWLTNFVCECRTRLLVNVLLVSKFMLSFSVAIAWGVTQVESIPCQGAVVGVSALHYPRAACISYCSQALSWPYTTPTCYACNQLLPASPQLQHSIRSTRETSAIFTTCIVNFKFPCPSNTGKVGRSRDRFALHE